MKVLANSMVLKLGYLVEHTAAILHRQSDQVLQERLGLGLSQFKLLMILQEHPNLQQRELAEWLGQTEASISRQIKILCEKGMLLVQINPKNRRQHLTIATTKGVRITQAAIDVLAEYHGPVFNQFNGKQQKQFAAMLESLHATTCKPGRPHACDHPNNL